MKLRFKLFLFFQFFYVGMIGPYLVVFLNQKNYSGGQIGLLLGTLPIGAIVFQPIWSYLSDVLNKRRILIFIGSLGLVVASLGLSFAESFIAALLWVILFSAMRAPIGSISTAIVLDYLDETGEREEYGLIRLWGSLGFAVSSILMAGLFLERILSFFPWFSGGMFLLLALLSLLLPESGHPFVYTGFDGIEVLTKNPTFTIYLLASVFIGATMGIYNNYMTLFLQSLEASSWLIGGIVSFQALVEVPMMMMVPLLLKHLSMRWLILIGALVLPLRWLLYTFIRQPAWIIPTQLINGVAVVSFFVVGVSFIDKLISPKWRATGQALYSIALMGIGSGLGVYFAGNLIEQYQIAAIWPFNLFLGLIGLVLIYVALRGFSDKPITPAID